MHKLLITTLAALLLAAGAYAQESMDMAEDMTEDMDMEAMDEAMDDMDTGPSVTVSASGGIGVKFTEKNPLSTFALFDVTFAASGTTDGGLTFGGSITIDGSDGDTSHVNDASVSIGSDIWTISAGNLDPATAKARVLGDIGFDGIGVDDIAEAATATAADIALGVELGGASMTITYGNKHTAEVAPVTTITGINPATVNTMTVNSGYDVWIRNPLYKAENDRTLIPAAVDANDDGVNDNQAAITAATRMRNAESVMHIAWHNGDRTHLNGDMFWKETDTGGDEAETAVTNVDGVITVVVSGDLTVTIAADGTKTSDAGTTALTPAETTAYEGHLLAAREKYFYMQKMRDDAMDRSQRSIFDNKAAAEMASQMLDCNSDGKVYSKALDDDTTPADVRTANADRAMPEADDTTGCVIQAVDEREVFESIDAATLIEETTPGSPASDDDEWAIALGFGAGGVEVAVGYDSNSLVNMGVKSSLGGVDAAAYIERPKGMESNLGINLGMTVTEGTTASVGFSKNGTTGADAVGVGLSFDLGGGAAFKMGAGVVSDDTVADMGVSMSF